MISSAKLHHFEQIHKYNRNTFCSFWQKTQKSGKSFDGFAANRCFKAALVYKIAAALFGRASLRKQGDHAAKNAARYVVLEYYRIGENTFYDLRALLRDLCDDMEE